MDGGMEQLRVGEVLQERRGGSVAGGAGCNWGLFESIGRREQK